MYVTGVDENGLGPRLGPMTTTAVTIHLSSEYDAGKLAARGLERGLTDSKAASSSRKMAFAESVSLALLEASSLAVPGTSDELFELLVPGGGKGLRAPCPDASSRAMCFGADLALPAFGGSVERGREALAPLLVGDERIEIVSVRTIFACAGVLNSERETGRNKLVLDLDAMERLSLEASKKVGEHRIVAGMIGGIRDVPKFASHIPEEAFRALETTKQIRAYEIDGVGELRFEVDADAAHFPVALASLVGKYARELGMHRIVAHFRADAPELEVPSGYHDPVTKRFVEATADARVRLAISPACFERSA